VPLVLLGRMPRSGVCRVRTVPIRARRSGARVPPQRVGEDANRTARGPDVFDFAGRDPVVDRTAANADRLARLHDRKCLSVHKFWCRVSGVGLRPVTTL